MTKRVTGLPEQQLPKTRMTTNVIDAARQTRLEAPYVRDECFREDRCSLPSPVKNRGIREKRNAAEKTHRDGQNIEMIYGNGFWCVWEFVKELNESIMDAGREHLTFLQIPRDGCSSAMLRP